jgi:hypothetical protein
MPTDTAPTDSGVYFYNPTKRRWWHWTELFEEEHAALAAPSATPREIKAIPERNAVNQNKRDSTKRVLNSKTNELF